MTAAAKRRSSRLKLVPCRFAAPRPLYDSPVSNSVLDLARDRAAAFLRELPERHAGAQATREELFAALHAPLSDDGEDPAAVVDALSRGEDRGLIACAGPR